MLPHATWSKLCSRKLSVLTHPPHKKKKKRKETALVLSTVISHVQDIYLMCARAHPHVVIVDIYIWQACSKRAQTISPVILILLIAFYNDRFIDFEDSGIFVKC